MGVDISLGQFQQLLATLGQSFIAGQPNAQNSQAARMLDTANSTAQATLAAEHQKKLEKEQEKKKKKAKLGKIGGIVGGLALAPFTGGMSLAGAGALTGLGSAAGQALGSGEFDLTQAATSVAGGALGGAALGKAGSAVKGVSKTAKAAGQAAAQNPMMPGGTAMNSLLQQAPSQAKAGVMNYMASTGGPATQQFGNGGGIAGKTKRWNPVTQQYEYI